MTYCSIIMFCVAVVTGSKIIIAGTEPIQYCIQRTITLIMTREIDIGSTPGTYNKIEC